MELPKLRQTVKIQFWSLRNGVGAGLGVIHDIDTQVIRDCYRVKDGDSWKWQIKGYWKLYHNDYAVETDQICLDDLGSDLEGVMLITSP